MDHNSYLSQKNNVGDHLPLVLLLSECYHFILCKVLVISLYEDLGEDPGSWTHGDSTLSRKLVWSTLIISTLVLHPH